MCTIKVCRLETVTKKKYEENLEIMVTVPHPHDFIRSEPSKHIDIEDIFRPTTSLGNEAIFQKMVEYLLDECVSDRKELQKGLTWCRRTFKPVMPKHSDLLRVLKNGYRDHPQYDTLFDLLVTKRGRSKSGVSVITVATSPYPEVNGKTQAFSCEWNCYYCPNEPGQPRSYLHDEPAIRRANANQFDPVLQFTDRANSMFKMGHDVDKVELIIIGGTWDSYPQSYRATFVRDLYYAANIFAVRERREKKTLEEEQIINETARTRVIGLTLETRPDTIRVETIRQMREFGCTRVQLGVQHTADAILQKINRKCTVAQVKQAIRMLKDACFKIDIHLMPNLPGSSPECDRQMFHTVLTDPDLQVDQWKIYPCEVLPWSVLKRWHDSGSYVPYDQAQLKCVLKDAKKNVHPWIRLNRIVRDIPSQYIYGEAVPHMRDELIKELAAEGTPCRCIRCREIGERSFHLSDCVMSEKEYVSSGGLEIHLEVQQGQYLCGFLRLRLPQNYTFEHMKGKAFVRELHVYGQMLPVGTSGQRVQHSGIGTRLLKRAEQIAFEHGYSELVVIAGIGTREYYRKKGYVCFDEMGYLYKPIRCNFLYSWGHVVFGTASLVLVMLVLYVANSAGIM